MPAYNAGLTIASAIDSVLAQTRQDFELIVVDDGSTDDTAVQVQPFLRDDRIRLIRQPNLRMSAARNAAIAVSRGKYVSLLDSDDLWMPRYLEKMEGALDSQPAAAVAYSDAWVLDDQTRRVARVTAMSPWHPRLTPEQPEAFLLALLERGNYVYGEATIRRSVLAEVGDFRIGLLGSEDYELWLRIAARGYRFVRCPLNLAIYRRRAGQNTADRPRMIGSLRDVFRIVAEEYDVPEEIRELARLRMHEQEQHVAMPRPRQPRRMPRLLRRPYKSLARMRRFHIRPPAEIRKAFPDLRVV